MAIHRNQQSSTALSSASSLDSLIIVDPSAPEEKQALFKKIYRFVSTQWTSARREALSDIRSVRWKRVGFWTPFALCTMAILGAFIFLTIYGVFSNEFESGTSACRSDDSFNFNISNYNVWTASGFFELNLAFGNLTFTQAKVIDISWDIVIGRGGQTLMAFISWRAFADYVTTSMEFAPITYTVFSIIFIQDEPSVFSAFRATRAFTSGRGLKSKVSMVFMILTMLFLLGWPTFASAMTGYTTIVKAFVPDYDSNYTPFSEFQPVAYIIHDGWRVNLTGNQVVSYTDSGYNDVEPIIEHGNHFFSHDCDADYLHSQSLSGGSIRECSLQLAAIDYVSLYGFFGLQNTTSLWMNTTIPSPVLNISAFYLYDAKGFYGNNWPDPRSTEQKRPFEDPSNITFAYDNQTYPLSYVEQNGRCQTVQDRFKWGFSYIQLFLVVTSLSIWTVGIYMMWLKARFQLPLRDQVEIPRGWRSILILASKMNKELRDTGIDPTSLTDRQLRIEIRKQLRGGSVSFDIPLRGEYSFRRGMWRWLKKEWKWCLILILGATLPFGIQYATMASCSHYCLTIATFGGSFTLAFEPILCLGIIFAMMVGSTFKSRIFMTSCWGVCGLITWLIMSVCLVVQVAQYL